MPSPPQVSVVIPAYNASKTIAQCLEAVTKQDFSGAYEIIVVNDGSTDNTASIVSKFKNVKLISQENTGPASARNTGARQAKGSIIVFMDSDCTATKNFLGEIAKPFEDAGISGVQGAYAFREGGLMERFSQLEIEQHYEKMRLRRFIDFIGSYAAAYRRDAFLKSGGFDPSFPVASGEDMELSFRMSKGGGKFVFAQNARVYHYHPASLGQYLRIKFFRGYWRVLVYRKHRKKVLSDSYTSQTVKLQIGMFYLAVAAGFGALAVPLLTRLFALLLALLLLTTLRFFLFALPRDPLVAAASIGIQLLRTAAFCAGLAYGTVKSAMGRI